MSIELPIVKIACEELTIECREKHEDYAMFLFTAGSSIVAQFPIKTWVLRLTNINLLKHLIANRINGVLQFPKPAINALHNMGCSVIVSLSDITVVLLVPL